jgi:DNA-binding MarR family transcriptional regulator
MVRAASVPGAAGETGGVLAIDRAPRPAGPNGALALVPTPAKRSRKGIARRVRSPAVELRHARSLVIAAEAVRKFPFAGLSDAGANGNGGIGSESIDDHLRGRDAALLAAFEQVLALAAERTSAAFAAQDGWLNRVRAGLLALLEFFDEQPRLARYCVVHCAEAGLAVQARRQQVLDRLARVLDDERAPRRGYPPPLTAQALVSGALGVLSERLRKRDPGTLVDLLNPLMSFIVMPFLGPQAARRELARPAAPPAPGAPHPGLALLQSRGRRLEYSVMARVLAVIGANPGLNNKGVARRAGIEDEAQASRILARAQRHGLIVNTREGQGEDSGNAWELTASGGELVAAVEREAAAPELAVLLALPPQYQGRLDHLAVSLLRAIGDQPWLTGRELAARVGASDQDLVLRRLADLARLNLAAGHRGSGLRGAPFFWQQTVSGEELDGHLGRESPPPPRSEALDLMQQSGGRLSDRAGAALRLIGAEPDLSNSEIALRMGITDQNTMSQMLAPMAQHALIENTRRGGRKNAWRLTTSGQGVERAIWNEISPAGQRKLAIGMLCERGGRLNNRVVAVLRLIVEEPGHSNNDIALRVGIESKGQASGFLSRLARFALIENMRTSGRENDWHPTVNGKAVVRAILKENPDAGH